MRTRDPRLRSLIPRLEKLPQGQIANLVGFLEALLDAQAIIERAQRGAEMGRAAKKVRKAPGNT